MVFNTLLTLSCLEKILPGGGASDKTLQQFFSIQYNKYINNLHAVFENIFGDLL